MKSFVILIIVLHAVLSAYQKDHHWHGKRHGVRAHVRQDKHHRPRLYSKKVAMPSGNSYVLTKPYQHKTFRCHNKAKLVELKPTSWKWKKEYNVVKKEMEKTNKRGKTYTVVKIQKIFNPCLYKRYLHRKYEVQRETRGGANERLLFHGSGQVLELLRSGFDERYANQNGYFGAGLYFADRSSKSNDYARKLPDGTRQMLLCRVTLGKAHKQQASNHYPHPPVGFHSVQGDLPDPEYIIYRGEQAYPEYLITYKEE